MAGYAKTGNSCTKCTSGCATCMLNATTCTACLAEYYLSKSKCVKCELMIVLAYSAL
ncbi:Fibrillarin/ Chromosome segregation ATPase [Giardia duodenalis assemblage B]|uniref:Chromosome segregation ATPase n=2 Tax=Giardia intestinalis TaxID=5741 RepID=V6TQV5_GIAIN|nr:Chromosome segregation ATPase [Giardia intestinalis]ESU41789.1 Fibrillarin [Giardia intestinalis]KWX11286.1 Fibrillarin/ Chromosome segregation ATPase [Giardia intestinalis assemblage B]